MVISRKMVPLVSFLAALRILTEAQSCNNGVGKLMFERVADYKLSGTNSNNFGGTRRAEVITRKDLPIRVLSECIRRCAEDRTTTQHVPQCRSFDFLPGKRLSPVPSHEGNDLGPGRTNIVAEYEDSSCYLYYDQASPDGSETLVQQHNVWHFNEVCITSSKVSTECSNRLYVMERTPGFRFEGSGDRELFAVNRTDCESKCINEESFKCRSCSFDRAGSVCRLSRETRAMNPAGFMTDANSDYMENLCLSGSDLCSATALILEAGKELEGAYERDLFTVRDFKDCSDKCIHSLTERGFMCRSFLYYDKSKTCVLYPDDPVGDAEGPDIQKPLKASSGDLYRVFCGTSDRDALINNLTFECYRRKRLDGPHQAETKSYSFQECLDECMRRYGRDCRSVEYSSRYQSCRFSSYDGSMKPSLVDDDFYDYYEFKWFRGVGGNSGSGSFGTRGGPWSGGSSAQSGAASWPSSGGSSGGGGNPWSNGGSSIWTGSGGSMSGAWPSGSADSASSSWSSGGSGVAAGGWASGPPGGWTSGGWTSSGLWPSAGAPPPGPVLPPWAGAHFGWPVPPPIGPHSAHGHFPPPPPPYPPLPPPELCGKSGGIGTFKKIGYGMRLRNHFIIRVIRAETLPDCERACMEARDFACLSFNFRSFFPDNCEMSDQDSHLIQIGSPLYFELNTQFDFYEREPTGVSPGCLDVSQSCTLDGMEFTLKTPDGFYGRIYTYGFYDTCFYDGNGGNVNVLRISRANGFPRCGTQQYGDVITNIVVVQFNDYVQTSRDKKYNLTCYFSGPGEAVVTSNYLDTRTDGRYPTQIEHLPAQNVLTSSVVLKILYRGAPTTTIAVGDLLTFRLEARGNFHWEYFADIFATNVIAKDPYSGRQVHLIDARGCPVDLYVFPELHRTPDGALEAEFYAFKIPDSNLLVFQATVQTCRGPCEPVICSDKARPGTFPSWGRKKRSASPAQTVDQPQTNDTEILEEEQEEVHELLKVYLSRSDIPPEEITPVGEKTSTVCVAQAGYYGMICTVVILLCLVVAVVAMSYYFIRRARIMVKKMATSGISASGPENPYVSQFQVRNFADPSEPIYTDPSLFERPRNTLQNMTARTLGKLNNDVD
ncbi:uncharacterized protein LOC118196873 isoform X1 [Stegodyphus dumicola]|uniref:uncharacterized protein LOC118196873 isoform X1 n=1 Tax=Stegodyphus dumicola TaxID=202533 RepID=UPI0015AF14AB|nr:uncharacterized protein LOC118196873 isoform X1 [Stegodyphus dumicola]